MKNIMRLCLVLLLSGISNLVAGQDREAVYESVTRNLQSAFNTRDPMRVYALTSSVYRERMAPGKFTEGTKKFYVQTGEWTGFKLREKTGEGITYTVTFERDTQILFIQLDTEGMIARFNFTPVPFVKGIKSIQVPSDNPLQSGMDLLVERLVRPYVQLGHTAGLSLAVVDGNDVHYYNYGEVRKGSNRLPHQENTIFEIGSLTKTFTSLLLADEVIRGQMSLKDPVNKYLPKEFPELRHNGTRISLVHLANHTSGFPRLPANIFLGKVDPADPYKHYTRDSVYSFLSRYQADITPGTAFSYSNFGAGLLGLILSEKHKQSFEDRLDQRIFGPLGMSDSKITLHQEDGARLAQGYDEKGVAAALWDLAALEGSGAIRSTAADMARYIQAQVGAFRTSLQPAISLTHAVTYVGPGQTMGLGWRIDRTEDNTYWHHSGGTGGFRSFIGFDQKRGLGVVILSNTAEDVTYIGQGLLKE